jgi:hypothetical protein
MIAARAGGFSCLHTYSYTCCIIHTLNLLPFLHYLLHHTYFDGSRFSTPTFSSVVNPKLFTFHTICFYDTSSYFLKHHYFDFTSAVTDVLPTHREHPAVHVLGVRGPSGRGLLVLHNSLYKLHCFATVPGLTVPGTCLLIIAAPCQHRRRGGPNHSTTP